MTLEEHLHIARINVLPATDKHVIGATDKVVKAVGIPVHDIAGVVPAVLEFLCRFGRQVQVSRGDRLAAHPQHTLVPVRPVHQLELGVGQRIA